MSFILYGCFPSPSPPKNDLAELLWAGGAEQVTMLGIACVPINEDAALAFREIRRLYSSTRTELVRCYVFFFCLD